MIYIIYLLYQLYYIVYVVVLFNFYILVWSTRLLLLDTELTNTTD